VVESDIRISDTENNNLSNKEAGRKIDVGCFQTFTPKTHARK